jgi:hypothetical protein
MSPFFQSFHPFRACACKQVLLVFDNCLASGIQILPDMSWSPSPLTVCLISPSSTYPHKECASGSQQAMDFVDALSRCSCPLLAFFVCGVDWQRALEFNFSVPDSRAEQFIDTPSRCILFIRSNPAAALMTC